MEVRDEKRKEKVDLKKSEKIEVLGEDFKKSLDKSPKSLLKKRELALEKSGGIKEISVKYSVSKKRKNKGIKSVNYKKTGTTVTPEKKSVIDKKKIAEHLMRSADTVSTEMAEKADNESGAVQMVQSVNKDLAGVYQKSVESTVHTARNIGDFAESRNGQKVSPHSPQEIRRKIREKNQRKAETPSKAMIEKTPDKKGLETEKKKSAATKKQAAEKKKQAVRKESNARVPDTRKKQERIEDTLGIRHESAFRTAMEENISHQHKKLHTQNNEKKTEKSRMSGVSNPDCSIIKNPVKDTLVETKSVSGENPGIRQLKKKKLLEFHFGKETNSMSAPAKKIGKILGKTSKKTLDTGAKASNPAGWVMLALAGVGSVMIICLFFMMVIFLGAALGSKNDDINNTVPLAKTLSVKVESYRNDVLEEAKKYHMEDYVDLFLAVMEVESHGNGNDVFQCSELLRLPRNSLSTPEESIAQGVKYLTACVKQAKVKSPSDIENIRTAVQGYNFGNGYIPWAIKRDGGWTQENALEFARIHSKGVKRKGDSYIKRAGPWNYGDQYYADHVMEYYGSDVTSNAGDCAKIPLKERMKWLFPEGTPKTSSQMSKYLIQISVPILDKNGKSSTMKLTVHKKLASEIKAVFEDLKKAGIRTIPSCTAAYNWRKMATNSSKLSYHSYGSVVDWNWSYNPICYSGTPGYKSQPNNKYMANTVVVDIWKAHGFYWGGNWKSYHDYMHFTYTNN